MLIFLVNLYFNVKWAVFIYIPVRCITEELGPIYIFVIEHTLYRFLMF